MKICPECNFNQLLESAKFCPECGCNLSGSTNSNQNDEELKLEVTEKESKGTNIVGEDEELILEGPNSSIEMSVDPDLQKELEPDDEELQLIGGLGSGSKDDKSTQKIKIENTDDDSTGKIKRLTAEEISQIEKKLYKNDPGFNNNAINAVEKDNSTSLFGNAPIIPPKKDEPEFKPTLPDNEPTLDIPTPSMAEHDSGVAYFYKRYIELVGSHDLHPNEELIVGKKSYELKPKQINPKVIFGGAAGLFVVLLIIIGSLISNEASQGQGNVWGIALDEYEQPLITNAKARLPELGKTIDCNAEGFFVFKDIPSGTHKIQLIWGDEVIGENFTTVTDNTLTTLTLRPSDEFLAKLDSQTNTNSSKDKPEEVISNSQVEENFDSDKSTSTQTKTKSTKTSSSSKWAKLSLAANVDNAVISLDGNVIGAGNLTYDRLKEGEYQFLVKKDGYYSESGNITLQAGKTQKLEIALRQLSEEDLRKTFSKQDFYDSGKEAYNTENYLFAIDEFTLAIKKDPAYIDAYVARAETHLKLKDWQMAHDDYLRVAEIYQFNKDYNQSISAYNKAIEIDGNSVPAYLGRAKLYAAKNEERAAIPDFEEVLKLDKRNSEAYYGLGVARYNLGSYNKAIELFKDALSLDERNALAHQYLMLCYYARNDSKNLKKAYSKFEEKVDSKDVENFRSNSENFAVIQIIDKN
ncbi:MAG: tetratricopeptide repeat protein [bacterium]